MRRRSATTKSGGGGEGGVDFIEEHSHDDGRDARRLVELTQGHRNRVAHPRAHKTRQIAKRPTHLPQEQAEPNSSPNEQHIYERRMCYDKNKTHGCFVFTNRAIHC